jgi:hypothetical protein
MNKQGIEGEEKTSKEISRRTFLKGSAATAASLAISGIAGNAGAFAEEKKNLSKQ